jgi:hypothetical protein
MNQPQTPNNCPYCRSEIYSLPCEGDETTYWKCGTDYVEDWGFARSSDCYESELAEKTKEVARLSELLNLAIEIAVADLKAEAQLAPAPKEQVWKCHHAFTRYDDDTRDFVCTDCCAHFDVTAEPEETQDGVTMDKWYGGFSKIESTEPVIQDSRITEPAPEWRELGPDELIQEGDEYKVLGTWKRFYLIGMQVKHAGGTFRTRRPLPVPKEKCPHHCIVPLEQGDMIVHQCTRCGKKLKKHPKPQEEMPLDVFDYHFCLCEDAGESDDLLQCLRCLRDEIQKLKEK